MEKSFSHQVGDIFVPIQLAARVGQEMGALNAAIATRADDEGSMVAKALMENHVCGWAASMKTHTNIKLAHKVVQVTLQCEENKQKEQVTLQCEGKKAKWTVRKSYTAVWEKGRKMNSENRFILQCEEKEENWTVRTGLHCNVRKRKENEQWEKVTLQCEKKEGKWTVRSYSAVWGKGRKMNSENSALHPSFVLFSQ